ncbi:MAG: hypothetical protein Kow0099_36520 [Candidatus Abyssubacteria bacterium]
MGIRLETAHMRVPSPRLESADPNAMPPIQAASGNPPLEEGLIQVSHTPSARQIGNAPPALPGRIEIPPQDQDRTTEAADRSSQRGTKPESTPEAREAPSLGVEGFRYLIAAQSVRERELETRYDQLKTRLENVSRRLQFAGSDMTRVDARLERVRLEHELDMVASQIRRLRLGRAFEGASANDVTRAESAPTDTHAPSSRASDSSTILDLLA